jgi:hypothetical protein
MFRFCGCCLWLFLLMSIIFFGNAVLWPSAPANSEADLGIAGCYFWLAAIVGFMSLSWQTIATDFDVMENAQANLKSTLISNAGSEDAFRKHDCSADWVRLLLSDDCNADNVESWALRVHQDQYLRHLPFFTGMLKNDVATCCKQTGMPIQVGFRLKEAIDSVEEGPFLQRAAGVEELKRILNKNGVMINETYVERIFASIDKDKSKSVTLSEFQRYMNDWKPMNNSDRVLRIVLVQIGSIGFWFQVVGLVGVICFLGPNHIWAASSTATAVYYKFATVCVWMPCFESLHQGAASLSVGSLSPMTSCACTLVACVFSFAFSVVQMEVNTLNVMEESKLALRKNVESASDMALARNAGGAGCEAEGEGRSNEAPGQLQGDGHRILI